MASATKMDAAGAPGPRGHERREQVRVDAEFEVNVGSDTNFYVGFSEDISATGIFVATHVLRPVGATMLIEFTLPGIPEPQRVRCEVRWVRVYNPSSDASPGMGLRFVEMSPETRALIDRFVAKRAPLFYDDEV